MVFPHVLYAYAITIYTDEVDNTKAKEVITLFKTTYPFNKFNIDFNIKTVEAKELNCKSENGIERLINCDSSGIAYQASQLGIDQVFIVKKSAAYGGSGGSIPVITTNSSARTLLHEFLHTLGLSDEYQYSKEEASIYCNKKNTPNMTYIEPMASGYVNDDKARSLHSKQIPWYSLILPTTFITHNNQSKLGTDQVNSTSHATQNTTNLPTKLGAAVGLYQGKTCVSATPPLVTWQPGKEVTIMENLDAGLGQGCEEIVEKILISRGLELKMSIDEIESVKLEIANHGRNADLKNFNENLNGVTGKDVQK